MINIEINQSDFRTRSLELKNGNYNWLLKLMQQRICSKQQHYKLRLTK